MMPMLRLVTVVEPTMLNQSLVLARLMELLWSVEPNWLGDQEKFSELPLTCRKRVGGATTVLMVSTTWPPVTAMVA